ncbi:MAG: sortase [Clostridiales bacterium]|nr:sortase [Clostridiales bacterium]
MNKKGNILITLGVLMIGAAFLLTGYNILDGLRAEKAAERETVILKEGLEEAAETAPDNFTADETPIYVRYPEMEMPFISFDGENYVGVLEIPSLGLELPVKGDYSLKGLKTAPCRFSGSVYLDNMIICGHNYTSHFGNLKNLTPGDQVNFTDGDGNPFSYIVSEIFLLDGTDVSAMEENEAGEEWDMTLFTCTVSGQQRVTVRLNRL